MNRFFASFVGGPGAVGLLVLRIVAGSGLMLHGLPKIQNPFGWMDARGPSGVPGIFQFLAAFSEFFGGLALIIGLLTPIAALGVAFTMLVAAYMGHISKGDPFVNPPGRQGGSWELASVYFAISLLLMLAGPGALSLDALLFGKKQRGGRVIAGQTPEPAVAVSH
jgi:putative oxidoreductase